MSLLSAIEVVNAATTSTRRYLEFLTEQNLGHTRHPLTRIKAIAGRVMFFDNSQWQVYSCQLPLRVGIRAEASATFVPHDRPGCETEIYIVAYEFRNGHAMIATRQALVDNEEGDLIIDFRWLVRRCLEWYESRGTSLAELTEIASLTTIRALPFVQPQGQSLEQFQATQAIITAGLSYIWGTPGTGKTTWVLAKAARYCAEQGERILLLASTNLAVDNALTAILKEGVAKEKVLRIGLPSEDFRQTYPECCEERAVQQRTAEITSHIGELEQRVEAIKQTEVLENRLAGKREALAALSGDRDGFQEQVGIIEQELLAHTAYQTSLQQETKQMGDDLLRLQAESAALNYPRLIGEIETLEAEQTQVIARLADTNKRLGELSMLDRVFTRRKRQFEESIVCERRHLESVEQTLLSKRLVRDQLAPRMAQYEASIAALRAKETDKRNEVSRRQQRIEQLTKEQQNLQPKLDEKAVLIKTVSEAIEDTQKKLFAIEDRCSPDLRDEVVISCQAKIADLKVQLSKFTQNLSDKSVLGMTLDGFIGLTLQSGLSVSRVFIDEAPYAPLAKVLPVLSLHRPIALLGDHYQLPPVCEVQDDASICAYWGKPAIFLEDAFSLGNEWDVLNNLDEARHVVLPRHILRNSYRFGPTLASLLDRHVYHNGLQGRGQSDTIIECVDCTPFDRPTRQRRENDSEADEIVRRVERWRDEVRQLPDKPDPRLAILTPYTKQRKLIERKLTARFGTDAIRDHVEVWNTHQAQGREWDYVFFSASDTRRLVGNGPWFSDSTTPVGRALVNTTLSRARKYLYVFFDKSDWRNRQPDSILTELAVTGGVAKGKALMDA